MNLRHYIAPFRRSVQIQNKLCSFDRRRRNVHTFDYFGRSEWNRFFPPFNSSTSKCNLRHQLQVTPLLIFGAKRKWKLKPFKRDKSTSRDFVALGGGGGVLPYKGLMGTCGQPGYVFRDFCLKQGIEFINFCLKQDVFSWMSFLTSACSLIFRLNVLNRVLKNRNSVLNRVGKLAIFVLNRVRVWGALPHLLTQGYIE